MKIKIIFHLFLVCNVSCTHNMETTLTHTDVTDKNLQKIINHINNNSLNIVNIIKKGAQHQNISVNSSTLASFLTINQEQINALFLETIEDDELRPLLFGMGADINAVTKENYNCLFFTKKPDLLKELIARGATVDIIDSHGYTPLYHFLLGSTLYSSEANKAIQAAHILLEEGKANPNIPNKYKEYPLHLAMEESLHRGQTTKIFPAMVILLLKHKADPNQLYTITNNSPLHVAVQHRHSDVIKALIKHGAKKNYRNNNKQTPYDLAKSFNTHRIVIDVDILNLLKPDETDTITPTQPENKTDDLDIKQNNGYCSQQ